MIKYLQDEVTIPLKVSTSRCNLALLVDLTSKISDFGKKETITITGVMPIQPHLSKIAIEVINDTIYKKIK